MDWTVDWTVDWTMDCGLDCGLDYGLDCPYPLLLCTINMPEIVRLAILMSFNEGGYG